MALENCPKCEKKLPPPFKSSGRQVCSKCAWTDKPRPKAIRPVESENNTSFSSQEEVLESSESIQQDRNPAFNSSELKSILDDLQDVDSFQELFHSLIGRTIGINYKEPIEFEAAILLEAKSQYFTILGESTRLKYRFPYRNILFVSNAEDSSSTIAVGNHPQKNFPIIVQINHLIVYQTQQKLNASGLIDLGLSFF